MHKTRLGSFFSADEMTYIRKNKAPYRALAHLLAAKESAFKASGENGAGPSAFMGMEVLRKESRRRGFCFQTRDGLQLSFRRTKDYVLAICSAGTSPAD